MFAQPPLFTERVRNLVEEVDDVLVVHLFAVGCLSELAPVQPEDLDLLVEDVEGVVLLHVVLFEELDEDQDEHVEHDEGAHHDEEDEVNTGKAAATRLAWNALGRHAAEVVHDLVPVFACGTTEKGEHGVAEVPEVVVLVDHQALLHFVEQEHAQHCEDEVHQEQQSAHVHQRRQREQQRFDQLLQLLHRLYQLHQTRHAQHTHDSRQLFIYFNNY